jgi:hypothetical protein
LTLVAAGENGEASSPGAALLLEMGRFRALAPGGVAPGQIPPGALANLSLLLLEPRDLDSTPAEAWLAYAPQVVISEMDGAQDTPPGGNWLALAPRRWSSVTTDGEQMWLETSDGRRN